ncbi:tail fiber domain-containing protein [Flavobacterium sp. AJR]|uniref:tail fiber domain-containing protein n=1 Tax=Flavobacterium sp. AJR TaxID=1979369 RepID=UPI000A3D88FE|nr:tail fiber domain-containing protein [Flavobacterium sp. AJR]OUL62806.1 hypothetical protein B8T70_08130 [Flavobacterium sp. AJR]
MKIKYLLFVSLFFLGATINAQTNNVGIGTINPDGSALLDLSSTDKGLLVPRIFLKSTKDVVTISNPAQSLFVYNASNIADIKPGFYYWDVDKWVPLSSGATLGDIVTTLTNDGKGVYVFVNEENVKSQIDVVGDIVNNAGDIFLNTDVVKEITHLVKSNETLTSLVYDATANKLKYNDEKGTENEISLRELVSGVESVTTITKGTAGNYIYKNEAGEEVSIDVVGDIVNNAGDIFLNTDVVKEITHLVKSNETLTSLVYDATANKLKYNDEKGTENEISLRELVSGVESVTTITQVVLGHKIGTYINEINDSTDLNETITSLRYDLSNNLLYTDENGIITTLNFDILKGATGPQGVKGDTGLAGINGSDGKDGATGPQGVKGDTGLAGINGSDGKDGATGPQGAKGDRGLTGPAGPQGVKGDIGLTGATGAQGAKGDTGPQGVAGVGGVDGKDADVGTQGAKGDRGLTGTEGPQGVKGDIGLTGATGAQGAKGDTGPQGVAGVGGVAKAGANVTIAGLGTIASPYVINSEYTDTKYTADPTTMTLASTVFAAKNAAALWNANQLQGKAVSVTQPTIVGQVLAYNGTSWVPKLVTEPWKETTSGNEATSNTQNIYQTGNVGIGGVSDATFKLKVYGAITATNFTQTSDQRYKKDIEPIKGALKMVKQMEGVGYNWRSDEFKDKKFDEKHQLGVIAQDILKIVPDAVSKDEKGYYTVNYVALVPVLIEAIKEQQMIIEVQEQKFNTQQTQINELRTLINSIKTEK